MIHREATPGTVDRHRTPGRVPDDDERRFYGPPAHVAAGRDDPPARFPRWRPDEAAAERPVEADPAPGAATADP